MTLCSFIITFVFFSQLQRSSSSHRTSERQKDLNLNSYLTLNEFINMSNPGLEASVQYIDTSVHGRSVPLLGSALWVGINAYGVDDEVSRRHREQATAFFAAVKWDMLECIPSFHRNGIPCRFEDNFALGHFNMVRRMIFEDGISWVARLRLPILAPDLHHREALRIARTLQTEISSMRFIKYVISYFIRIMLTGVPQLRAKTSFPVPEIHRYDIDPNNNVGAPYILMDYIHGTVAMELQHLKDCGIGLYGTPDQDQNFKWQMANIQAELSLIRFNKIGSLYQDGRTFDFFIGPEAETGKGPWTAVADY